MQQIADWLQKLGLGQYAQRFAENDINFGILSDLTDQDLKELGVASLGHRRQLLRAITELKGGETGTPDRFAQQGAPSLAAGTSARAWHAVGQHEVGLCEPLGLVSPYPYKLSFYLSDSFPR